MTDILQEASELISGQRAKDYGDVTDNFQRIAALWGAYLGHFDAFTEHDVSMMMILVKVARQAGGYHRDSNVDIAGYAALDEKVADAQADWESELEAGYEKLAQQERAANATDWDEFWSDIDESIAEAGTNTPKPRVWESIKDIPEGVVAKDTIGWSWKVFEFQSASSTNGTSWSSFKDFRTSEDRYGPFTEVLS